MNFEIGNVSIKLLVKVGSEESTDPFKLSFNIKFNNKEIGSFQITLENFDTSLELRDLGKNSILFKPSNETCEKKVNIESTEKKLQQTCDNEQEEDSPLVEDCQKKSERELRKGSPKNYRGDAENYLEGKQDYKNKTPQTMKTEKKAGKIKKFECDDCGVRFASNSKLKIHHDSVHKKLKPFECTECGKKFGRKDYLVSHLKIHTKDKPIQSQVCGERFSQKSDLVFNDKSTYEDSVTSNEDDTSLPTFTGLNENQNDGQSMIVNE